MQKSPERTRREALKQSELISSMGFYFAVPYSINLKNQAQRESGTGLAQDSFAVQESTNLVPRHCSIESAVQMFGTPDIRTAVVFLRKLRSSARLREKKKWAI